MLYDAHNTPDTARHVYQLRLTMMGNNDNPQHYEHIQEFCSYADAVMNEQAYALWSKIDALEARIAELEKKDSLHPTVSPRIDEKALHMLKTRIINLFR